MLNFILSHTSILKKLKQNTEGGVLYDVENNFSTLTLFSFVARPFLLILHRNTIFYNLLKVNIVFMIT